MAAFRLVAWVLIALGVAFLGADGVTSLEAGSPVVRSTADILTLFSIDGANIVSNSPGGLSQALGTVLGLPLWAVVGVLGVVLALIFRPID